MQNLFRLATTILKFIVDAATMKLINHDLLRCLKFASTYARHVVSAIERHKASFVGEGSKEMLTFLKSSFTYAAKLLHLVLTRSSESSAPPPGEAFYLSNDLLDVISSVESYLGSKFAVNIISVAKEWLPILVLGLGCNQLIKPNQKGGNAKLPDFMGVNFPVWLSVLSETELLEFNGLNQDDQENQNKEAKSSVFKKLAEMIVVLLKKGSPKILDAVGGVFMAGLDVGLERTDSGLVLGLAHFLCVKLLDKDFVTRGELDTIYSFLQDFYLRVERRLRDHHISESSSQQLESANALIRSVLEGAR